METFFDRLTAKVTEPDAQTEELAIEAPAPEEREVASGTYTPKQLKAAIQELLKFGLLEADKKPNLYRTTLIQREAIDRILEPLDLRLTIDDVRGLAFLVVAEPLFDEEVDEWAHPLVRRQRLTLEQSLLVAILRQHYVGHEQEAGIGGGGATVVIDELLPQLQVYLGDTGSDLRNGRRLRTLLDTLKSHGIVSEIDERDRVTIRPIITHLANPESLQNLLQHLRSHVSTAADSETSDRGDDEESP